MQVQSVERQIGATKRVSQAAQHAASWMLRVGKVHLVPLLTPVLFTHYAYFSTIVFYCCCLSLTFYPFA